MCVFILKGLFWTLSFLFVFFVCLFCFVFFKEILSSFEMLHIVLAYDTMCATKIHPTVSVVPNK